MNLKIIEVLEGEIAHFYEPKTNTYIFSRVNKFCGLVNGISFNFTIPIDFKTSALGSFRVTRRLSRADKSTAALNYQRDGLIVLYQGTMYFYDFKRNLLITTGKLKQCRNISHRGIAVTNKGIYFGEYGSNKHRKSVPIWRSIDDGRSWLIIYEFAPRTIRHVHGVYFDKFSKGLWIPTGDFAGECYLAYAPNENFDKLERYGSGHQQWRPVSLFFGESNIYWGMDTELETSYLQTFDRQNKTLQQGREFPGPVWYSKQFSDEISILATTVEIGPGSTSNSAKIFASKNFTTWSELKSFKKDWLPKRYFKFGVIAFADGRQSSSDFVIFGEALNGLDGKILKVAIE